MPCYNYYVIVCIDSLIISVVTVPHLSSAQLDEEFRNMMDDTIKLYKTNPELYNYLVNLPPPSKLQHEKFLEIIQQKKNNDEILFELTRYSNFLNYTFLEHLINKVDDKHLKARMREYKKKLKDFRVKTLVCDFIQYYRGCLRDTVLKEVEVKVDRDWSRCTLEDLEEIKETITQGLLLLPRYTMNLSTINPGCICITWTIHEVVATSLIKNIWELDMSFCEKQGIISLSVDGVELFPSLQATRKTQRNYSALLPTGRLK